jgi:hypothetical protein
MNTPNYFLADLSAESLTAEIISEACITIKRNRHQFLLPRKTAHLVQTIATVARDWLDPNSPIRQRAINEGSAETGFSQETLARGLDEFFGQLNRRNLESLILQDLGHLGRIDEMVSTDNEHAGERAARAVGSELLVHIAGGVIPNPTIVSMILGILARSAQFVKCPADAAFLPRLFAHSIYAHDPKLGACLELGAWPGGERPDLEQALYQHATTLTATGSDETLAAIRAQLPPQTRFIGYGHRLSLGFVTAEMLSSFTLPKIIARAADDMTAWDQLGCLSPHNLYVETGGAIAPEKFAELLAAELDQREQSHPRGQLTTQEHAAIATRRSFYEVRAAAHAETRLWKSSETTAWTVIFEANPDFQTSCLNRFIYIKPVIDLDQLLVSIDRLRGQVSTIGLAAAGARAQSIANQLSQWGVTRICPLGQMQNPPLRWRHDGRPPLGELITWTDWEMEL